MSVLRSKSAADILLVRSGGKKQQRFVVSPAPAREVNSN